MKTRILLFTMLLISVFMLKAQITMNIHQSNGTVLQIPMNNIDSITYTINNPGSLTTISTLPIGNITSTSATSGGNITNNGGSPITQRGIVWSTSPNPTTANNSTNDGSGTGNFTSNLLGLTANTTYYVRAYASNTAGTAYGNELSFTTSSLLATLSTTSVSSISSTTAVSGGNITNNGGSPITQRGIVWSSSPNPTTANNSTNDGSGTGNFTSNLSGLTVNTTYYVRAYATNTAGTAYGNELSFTTSSLLATLSTTSVSSISSTTAVSGGNITNNGGSPITQRGIVWSTSPNPTTANNYTNDGSGTGNFISNLSGLTVNTTYYVRAYATNTAGTAYGNELSFTTSGGGSGSGTYPPGSVHCSGTPTVVVDVTNPATGKTWMDRNLGASQVATSSTNANSYGDLYQWGRGADGHQCRNSATTTTLSITDTLPHGNFILTSNAPYDWRSPQNTNLWQGVSGINNPCPSSYRLPTETELNAERLSWSSNDAAGAFASPLKLPISGLRNGSGGSLLNVGIGGVYWSSSVSSTNSRSLNFSSSLATISIVSRSDGRSVRCIKD